MTAINMVRRQDAVFLMTDAAAYDRNGIVREIAPKAILLPQVPAAIAVRGSRQVQLMLLAIQQGGLRSLDELLEILPTSAKVAVETAAPIAEFGIGEGRAELIIAGWSAERQRPESYIMYCYSGAKMLDDAGAIVDVEPFTAVETGPILATVPPDTLCAEYGCDPRQIIPERFEPISQGTALLQAQRRSKGDLPFYSVGGYINLVSVYPAGIDSRIIHTWPDEVGQKIEPNRAVH